MASYGEQIMQMLPNSPLMRRPNTYDPAAIRAQGMKRSEGVNPDGSIPGYQGNLNPAQAGNNWTTIGVQDGGLNLTYVVPAQPGDTPQSLLERFKRTRQHYGAFETDQAGADYMRGRTGIR
jgi:hypothetical protein